MAREVRLKLDTASMIGRKIHYNGREVGHIVNIKDGAVICSIDDNDVAHMINGGKTTCSMEVVDR